MNKEKILRHLNLILENDINTLKGFDIPHEALEEEIEVLKETIKFIEQEPCEDAISRQDAIKYLCTNMNWYNEDGETADDEEKLNAITDLVNGVPPATPQPKAGYWIDIDEESHTAICSCCNRNNLFYGDYCKWCGAKMEEMNE